MKIRLERKCRATHKWEHVANFRFLHDAQAAAELFSKLDECDQRVIDQRWVEDGDETTLFRNGKLVP
jgi:hypothetical protein